MNLTTTSVAPNFRHFRTNSFVGRLPFLRCPGFPVSHTPNAPRMSLGPFVTVLPATALQSKVRTVIWFLPQSEVNISQYCIHRGNSPAPSFTDLTSTTAVGDSGRLSVRGILIRSR